MFYQVIIEIDHLSRAQIIVKSSILYMNMNQGWLSTKNNNKKSVFQSNLSFSTYSTLINFIEVQNGGYIDNIHVI